jgi:ArsR family transcriptional regulator
MKEVTEMCKSESKKGCEHPEKLKGKPGQCSPLQIKECHGEVKEHACVKKK